MKKYIKILLWIILVYFTININLVNAWGWPSLYSWNYWLYWYKKFKDIENPEYNFEINNRENYDKMSEILFKYYNKYNFLKFKWKNTYNIKKIIKKIENKLNNYNKDCEYNYCYKFLIKDSVNEATFDILQNFWYNKDFYIYWTNPKIIKKWNINFFEWVIDFDYLNGNLTYWNYISDSIEDDIYQITYFKKWYKLFENLKIRDTSYFYKLKAILNTNELSNFKIKKIVDKKEFNQETYKSYFIDLNINKEFNIDLNKINKEFFLETWFYFKKWSKYIKIPSVDDRIYYYSIDKIFNERSWEYDLKNDYCNKKLKNKITWFFNNYKIKNWDSKYKIFANKISKKIQKYLYDEYFEIEKNILKKAIDEKTFEFQYKIYKKEVKKNKIYSCIYNNIPWVNKNTNNFILNELLIEISK